MKMKEKRPPQKFRTDKIRVRYSAGAAAAHQLPCTVPAAGQSLSVGTQSVQTQPAMKKKKVIHLSTFVIYQ